MANIGVPRRAQTEYGGRAGLIQTQEDGHSLTPGEEAMIMRTRAQSGSTRLGPDGQEYSYNGARTAEEQAKIEADRQMTGR